MANIIKITDINAPELDVFVRMTGNQLKSRLHPENSVFIAESPTVTEVALSSGCEPISILTDERLLRGSVTEITERCGDIPVYVSDRDTLSAITGFELTRGLLCAMKRPASKTPEEICRGARRIAVFEDICDATNIGALFRSAAAMHIDAVLLTPGCCDALCRRAVRVSMGTVFQIPFAQIGSSGEEWDTCGIELLHRLGFKTAAMALTDNSVSIEDGELAGEERLAIILGTEGTGLKKGTIEASDYTVKIPMSHGVDSLNVAAAGAVAFWQLTRNIK